ncbi:[protein-PII] uridylyltransferase [Nocardia sp. CNY236]|uniref:[protein-PII] uridylyltransferase n=1 Tax=Nocardia sp. CNY236 TaxID=1169152 RepID=UPI00055A9B0C|nr:[protein-PII] uridylyltransferase [Nocardia sp. CNY236]
MASGAADLVRARGRLLDGGQPGSPRLDAESLRAALVDLHELWLTNKGGELGIAEGSGLAVMAVGGLGRGEMLPYSDLDLVLVHAEVAAAQVAEIADRLWYPLWDAHIKLDHSVRTVSQAVEVAAGDLIAALGMLEARHIVGDQELSSRLIGAVRREWRSGIHSRFDELVDHTRARWQRAGEIAHRAEPDLKNGRGGLRDIQLLDALAIAQLTDPIPGLGPETPGGGLRSAHRRLLDVRTELHRVAGRPRDQLHAQDADEIGAALRLGDRFDLARTLSDAARTVGYSVDVGLRTAGNALPRRGLARLRRKPLRRPLDEGVVEHAGEVVLARDARPHRDPGLVLRVAAASARTALPISATTLNRLSEDAPELREPWPTDALDDLLVLLGAGRGAADVIEALDRTGLWGRLLPEWGAVRDLPPRDAMHTWTVDRHLVETAAQASTMSTRVARPDLLSLGAVLHDIGKGRAGDHSVVGAELATRIGRRLGLRPSDVHTLGTIVRHHLLLPEVATRRDPSDPETVRQVVDALEGDPQALEVLHVLAEADSLATGPGVWGDWKSSLIGELVRRCRMAMAGDPAPMPAPISPEMAERARAGGVHVDLARGENIHAYTVTVVVPDGPDVLSAAAGVLALHSLQVLSASLGVEGDCIVAVFGVTPTFGDPPEVGLLRQDVIRATAGNLDVSAALAKRERAAGDVGRRLYAHARPRVIWSDTSAPGPAVLELRAEDRVGLLSRLAAELARCGANVRWASVVTWGAAVVDRFGLDVGAEDGPARREAIADALLAVVPGPAPKPSENAVETV